MTVIFNATPENVATKINDVCTQCSFINRTITLPRMKTIMMESTDAGPGVSIHQHDVKMRIGQRIRIQNSDY